MKYSNLSSKELDKILAIQFAIAWAGEGGEEPRLSWWKTEIMSECGGYDNLKQIAPDSAEWLGFKAIREAARLTDEELRRKANSPDKLLTLYHLGFELDEQLDQRLSENIHSKASWKKLIASIEWLKDPIHQEWEKEMFTSWLKDIVKNKVNTQQQSIGRRLTGDVPEDGLECIYRLTCALLPLAESYPLPHYRNI